MNPISHVMLSWQPRQARRTDVAYVDKFLDTLGTLFDEKDVRKDLDYKA